MEQNDCNRDWPAESAGDDGPGERGLLQKRMYGGAVQEELIMDNNQHSWGGYALAALLGAIGGGLVVAVVTQAIPKMMSQIMAGMMQTMMSRMREGGCNPAEM